jgi:hypothetical protein
MRSLSVGGPILTIACRCAARPILIETLAIVPFIVSGLTAIATVVLPVVLIGLTAVATGVLPIVPIGLTAIAIIVPLIVLVELPAMARVGAGEEAPL